MGEAIQRPIWAKWRIDEGERVVVTGTYREGDGFVRREMVFDDLEDAERALGRSFREVVDQVVAEGRRAGRWRP